MGSFNFLAVISYLAAWIILPPLAGALVNGFLAFKDRSDRLGGIVGCVSVGLSFLSSLTALGVYSYLNSPMHETWFRWISVSGLSAGFSFVLDPLSILMACIITGVGFFIHLYSVGYMASDERRNKYFAFLNLFTGSMLVLVLAANFLVMFIGWELVGLCSYLLIGFWFEKDTAANAGKKAFIVNRVGDFGFLLGIFLVFYTFGTLDFDQVNQQAPTLLAGKEGLGMLITLLLFLGATGKSAQLPLHIWLPDAMEGPTPVSALIHAATMVTAGIYMVARNHMLFSQAPLTMDIIAMVGCVTAFMAASIGLFQNDLKRILAYSTISQLGYMFLGLGVYAFAPAMFHLFTHAFFKALLFLAAGSVMHALSGELDITKMGGLRKKMPVTFYTFGIGALALAGIPGFSGFFSKDEILLETWSGPHACFWLWLLAALTALLTNLYVFRMLFLVFFGENRDQHLYDHAHESPLVMTLPLMVLGFFAFIGGYINLPSFIPGTQHFAEFLNPVLALPGEAANPASASMTLGLMVLYFGLSLLAFYIAYLVYLKGLWKSSTVFSGTISLLTHKYYVDEIYQVLVVKPLYALSRALRKYFDDLVIDGAVNGTGSLFSSLSRLTSRWQTGQVHTYLVSFLVGAALLFLYIEWGVR